VSGVASFLRSCEHVSVPTTQAQLRDHHDRWVALWLAAQQDPTVAELALKAWVTHTACHRSRSAAEGRLWRPPAHGHPPKPGPTGDPHGDAQEAAFGDSRLIYVEGFALAEETPTAHAWTVRAHDCAVIDPALGHTAEAWFGVAVRTGWLRTHHQTGPVIQALPRPRSPSDHPDRLDPIWAPKRYAHPHQPLQPAVITAAAG